MEGVNERLKQIRKSLNLSQEFVAKQLGMTRTAVVAIEAGKRKVTSDELEKFAKLYGVSTDEFLYGDATEGTEVRAFACTSDKDKKEIMNLMNFKKRYKASYNGEMIMSSNKDELIQDLNDLHVCADITSEELADDILDDI